jgi:hypothetical protein
MIAENGRSTARRVTGGESERAEFRVIAPERLKQFIWPAPLAAQAIHVAAKLGLADLLGEQPRSVDHLATVTGTHGPTLRRLLKALTSLGVFSETVAGEFENTPLSETLRKDHPESIRPWAIMLGADFVWRAWGELNETITNGKPAFDRIFGTSFFDYLTANPRDAAIFNAAMAAGSSTSVSSVLAAYDFSPFERVVDVGGGHGALLQGILSANPTAHGLLYDLPAVVAGAQLQKEPIRRRCEVLGGDFFKSVPDGADAYVLKGIIHDWNDEDALKILKNCRRAIRSDGKLLLLETVLQPSSVPARALMDLFMLVLVNGRERTEDDFRTLLQDAGFSLVRVIPTPSFSIVEGRPLYISRSLYCASTARATLRINRPGHLALA